MVSDPPETEVSEAPPASKTDKKTDPRPPLAPPDTPPAQEPRRRRPWLLALLAVFAAVAAFLIFHNRGKTPAQEGTAARGGPGGKGGQNRPVPVLATAAQTKDVGVYLTGLGTVAPLNTVTVKSRVDGQLLRIDFQEGQIVHAGDLLAEIDPRPFQVQLMQAEGQMAKDQAALQNAQVDLQRYQMLVRPGLDRQAAARHPGRDGRPDRRPRSRATRRRSRAPS